MSGNEESKTCDGGAGCLDQRVSWSRVRNSSVVAGGTGKRWGGRKDPPNLWASRHIDNVLCSSAGAEMVLSIGGQTASVAGSRYTC